MTDKRQQVIDQCRVVAHLATVLAKISADYQALLATGKMDELLDIVGDRTAFEMEALGDMLNATDAVSDEDAWTHEIFERAQQMFPQETRA